MECMQLCALRVSNALLHIHAYVMCSVLVMYILYLTFIH